jgi:hypothetical protein
VKNSHWILVGILALAPAAVFAQQEQKQPEAEQVKTEAAQTAQTPPTPETPEAQPDESQPKKDEDPKLKSVPGGKALGMSILGNQEAPKALVIVPWKRSELGSALGISTMLDDSRLPIDKEVFMRMLSYYEIRSETALPAGAPAKSTAAQPSTAAHRRK